jgi:hypothetical protein
MSGSLAGALRPDSRSSRLQASAKRRYVSTLAATTRASTRDGDRISRIEESLDSAQRSTIRAAREALPEAL